MGRHACGVVDHSSSLASHAGRPRDGGRAPLTRRGQVPSRPSTLSGTHGRLAVEVRRATGGTALTRFVQSSEMGIVTKGFDTVG